MSGWGVYPEQLGLTVAPDGSMRGPWKGVTVAAHFQMHHMENSELGRIRSRRRGKTFYYTNFRALLDPPLGAQGLDGNVYFNQLIDRAFRSEIEQRAWTFGVSNIGFSDDAIVGTSHRHETALGVYQGIFDLFAWAANTIQDRRSKYPPAWEQAIAQAWPSLAQGWGMQLDTRRGEMSGTVHGRPTSARIVNAGGSLMTCIEVAAPLPPGCSLSLSRQNDHGFFDHVFQSLVGGGDINVGDPAFDAAFIIKGQPEAWVREALTPLARDQILALANAGASITFEDGYLTVWTKDVLTRREDLDPFMKAAYAAAAALGQPTTPSTPPSPYR